MWRNVEEISSLIIMFKSLKNDKVNYLRNKKKKKKKEHDWFSDNMCFAKKKIIEII